MFRLQEQLSITLAKEGHVPAIVFIDVGVPQEPTFVLWTILSIFVKKEAFLFWFLHDLVSI